MGSSPTPAIVLPSTWALRLKCFLVVGTRVGTLLRRFLGVQRRGDRLPPVPLLSRWLRELAAVPHVLRWAWWALFAAALLFGIRYFRYSTMNLGAGHFLVRDRVSGEVCHYDPSATALPG